MLSTILICILKKKNVSLNFNLLVNPIFKRFFSLEPLKKSVLKKKKKNLDYRFYDSQLFQPVFKKTFMNFRKPEFVNYINRFGDLPNILIKHSKWFSYWKNLIYYWRKKSFLFISRDLSNLKVISSGVINLSKYLELPLGISYSAFWLSFLKLRVPNSDYKWLRVYSDVENKLTDVVLKKMFKTTKTYILLEQELSLVKSTYCILVRTNLKETNLCLYGFKCSLDDTLQIKSNLTIFRDAKKKWAWLKIELTDFIYFVHNLNKRCVYYQHIGGHIKKIKKLDFDLLKKTLPIKVRKGDIWVGYVEAFSQ